MFTLFRALDVPEVSKVASTPTIAIDLLFSVVPCCITNLLFIMTSLKLIVDSFFDCNKPLTVTILLQFNIA
jgi:hypothetical protein